MLGSNRAGAAEIRTAVEQLADALRRKDVDKVLSSYTGDKVQFLLAPPLQNVGDNAIDAKSLKAWFDTFDGPIGFEVTQLRVTAGDNFGFSHGLNRISGTKTSGETMDVWVRETLCFRRIDGAWKIAHQHESVPFYTDSLKAAVDLKP